MYINESYQIAPGALGDEVSELEKQLAAAKAKQAAAKTPAEKSKWDKVTDFAGSVLENYYRGKISSEQLAAQQAQMMAMMQARGGGMQQYLPLILIGGVAIVGIVLLTRK